MAKKPHILLMSNYSNQTGYAWINIYRLYNLIAKTMHQNGLGICLSFAQINPPINITEKIIPIKSFVYNPLKVSLANIFHLASHIRKHNIRYVYTTDLSSYHWTYPIMRLLGVKAIITHNRISVADPYPAKAEIGIKRLIKYMLTRIAFINVDKIYCVSHFVRNRLIQKHCIAENKLIRILNGIDINKFTCPSLKPEAIIKIFVGARANKHKGAHILIEAANLLIQEHNITNFVINYAGDGPDLAFLKNLASSNNLGMHVNFLGELRGTQAQICQSDIIVVPSIWGDACPSAISEALAAGKPLITSRAGGIPEIVGDNKNAIIIEPGDKHMMANKIAELIRNPNLMASYGKNARLRAESALDEKAYYETVIKQLKSDFKLAS